MERLSRFDEAQKVYEKALQLDPDNLLALEGMYRVLSKEGKDEELVDYATKLLSSKEDLSIHKAKINALIKLGRTKEAFEEIDVSLQKYPKEQELLSRKRDAAWALGMGDETVKDCEQILSTNPHYSNRCTISGWHTEGYEVQKKRSKNVREGPEVPAR